MTLTFFDAFWGKYLTIIRPRLYSSEMVIFVLAGASLLAADTDIRNRLLR